MPDPYIVPGPGKRVTEILPVGFVRVKTGIGPDFVAEKDRVKEIFWCPKCFSTGTRALFCEECGAVFQGGESI